MTNKKRKGFAYLRNGFFTKAKHPAKMGNKASKPTRKLAKTVSEHANPTVNRASNINQLPSELLKQQYQQHYIQQESHKALQGSTPLASQDQSLTPDESLNQTPAPASYQPGKFDAAFLKKKLNQNDKLVSKTGPEPEVTLPEGKDGFDPQVGNQYNPEYVNSIFQLGKQIQTQTMDQKFDPNILALKQLNNRKSLFEKGQQELQHQMEPNPNGAQHEDPEVVRTMIHPRTLTAILTDLKDPRVDNSTITKDYQLHPSFVEELGHRFKVATNAIIIEEDVKEDEIAPKIGNVAKARVAADGDQLMMDYNGEVGETINTQRLKTLQSRLGIEDEEEPVKRP